MIQKALLTWFDTHKRDLPWRRTNDPYAIWVSEIMLQQTQVKTVIPYFERWMVRFPTVSALASASEAEVLEMWQGLGYYRRGRMLLQGARYLAATGLPKTAEQWRSVPGVGPYTAGAIASIALAEPVPLVDGNVERVYARLTASFATDRELHREAWTWAASNVDRERPGDWNQALMELGATICTPREPLCSRCPVSDHCCALRQKFQHALPVPSVKRETVRLHHRIIVPWHEGRFGVVQTPAGEWWQGMWGFPREDAAQAGDLGEWHEHVATFTHAVTHHRIKVDVYLVRVEQPRASTRWVPLEELDSLALPSPQRKALQLVLKSKLLPL